MVWCGVGTGGVVVLIEPNDLSHDDRIASARPRTASAAEVLVERIELF